ncbi:INO80 complex subunit B-like [Hibiscus syriacus]|nr:INO80 complex subunit B-like [Hibiscus syriacus]
MRTIHANLAANGLLRAASSVRKNNLQGSANDGHSPTDRSGLQGVPWKDFSKGGFGFVKEDSLVGKTSGKNISGKLGDHAGTVRKSKRVPKRRLLDGEFSDDEIRCMEKLKISKISPEHKEEEDESSKKQKKISTVSNIEKFGTSRSAKNEKRKHKSDKVSEDTNYEEEDELVSDTELEGKKKKKQRKETVDTSMESKREITLTTRQRALQTSKDATSAPGSSLVEFPNGLPPAPSRKQKEKLSEVEQQLKKAEAAQRRRMQVEKANRESEAEAIRKILGQDSSRKKREEKIKMRQEALAQEKAVNEEMLASNTIRLVMGPTGTTVTFPRDLGFPPMFDSKPLSYPAPRENCAGPSCTNPYKYRDSKLKLPLCSLQCYKAIQQQPTC